MTVNASLPKAWAIPQGCCLMVGSLFYSTPAAAQVSPTTKKAAVVRITRGPEIEPAEPDLTLQYGSQAP